MFNRWPTQDPTRWWLAGFLLTITASVAVTVCSALGAEAVRTLMLSSLAAVFVCGGILLGALAAWQLAETHLDHTMVEESESPPEAHNRTLRWRPFERFLAGVRVPSDSRTSLESGGDTSSPPGRERAA